MKNIEEANKQALQRIKDYRQAVELIPKICLIVKSFDGKVFNCKLEKALREAIKNRVGVEKRPCNIAIYTYYEHSYNTITLAELSYSDMIDGKRIDADKIIKSAHEKREALLKRAYDIEQSIETMPQTIAYIEESINKVNGYLEKLSSEIQDIYGLPYRVRGY